MTTPSCFAPRHQNSQEPIQLAMQRLWLTGRILPAGARLTVQHTFKSAETKPIEVIYSFPLPRDAALRSFRITGDGFEALSELRETEAAVKAYEEGIAQGSLATLARQYGDGLINLNVGNIQPGEKIVVYLELIAGVELRDDGFRFRFPFTLAPSYHSRARYAVVDSEGEMELPADEFGDVILPRFRQDASALHQIGFDVTVEAGLEIDELGSPSHVVRIRRENETAHRVMLAAESDVPDRDLVLDAHYRTTAPQVVAGKGKFAAVIPSTAFGAKSEAPRRVVILLDRSGSMQGAPITQAQRAIEACLAALSETDLFGLLAFDNQVEVCEPHLLTGTRENRDRAHQFLEKIYARGGTHLVLGFQKAVELLEGGGGDVLILTDGQVSGTEQILAEARRTYTRLHCLGIGSASQDRFLALLARETGGISRFVTPNERVDIPAVDLFASVGEPVASGLKAMGIVEPEPPASVFTGTPVLLFGDAQEGGKIEIVWDWGGSLTLPVAFGADATGEAVRLLQGARLITDWESRYPSAEALAPIAKRQGSRIATRLRELSQAYGLASREMSLVAVVKRTADRPGQLPETRVVPVGMPQDTPFGAYFPAPVTVLKAANFAPNATPASAGSSNLGTLNFGSPLQPAVPPPSSPLPVFKVFVGARKSRSTPPPPPTAKDWLLELAASLDSDGGIPGDSEDVRAAASAVALLAFLADGHTPSMGAFRSHVARLVHYLESLSGLDGEKHELIARVLAAVRAGQPVPGDWIPLARSGADRWGALAQSLGG